MIDEDLPIITGSGAIVNDGYWVLTNKHVVEDLGTPWFVMVWAK